MINFKYATTYVQLRSALPNWQLTNTTVLVRADLNVPINKGTIVDDQKCNALRPTLDLLLQKKAKIILLTHLGRPKNNEPELSTRHLVPWFEDHGYSIEFAQTTADIMPLLAQSPMVLFENVRFFNKQDQTLAAELARFATHYIMDAFGSIHRDDFSLTTLARMFAPDKRTIGLLVEHELKALAPLIINPARPFVTILGGGKVADKLPLLMQFASYVDSILVCPAISNSFAKAQGFPVGKSLIDEKLIETIKTFLGKQHKATIHLPVDYIIGSSIDDLSLKTCSVNDVQNNAVVITVGPKTVEQYTQIILMAKTIFFNGLPGFLNKPDTLVSTHALMNAMAASNAYTVIGGGDSVGAAHQFGLANKISFLSTGGGATLALLADQQLPALDLYRI